VISTVGKKEESNRVTNLFASADGAVPGLLNQVMGVRISPEAPDYVVEIQQKYFHFFNKNC
jgi:hypothetical protein